MADEVNCGGSCDGCDAECAYNGGATVTLNLDDGTVQECAVLTIYEAAGKSYIALLPLDENGQNEDGEVYLYRINREQGDPQLENIESDEEYEAASDGFEEWLDNQEYDDLVTYDEDGNEAN